MFATARGRGRLAARRTFPPRAEWRWPGLNVKVFLAAHWVADRRDLNLALRNAVEWLRQLDPDELAARISALAAWPGTPSDRWFEAVSCLLTLTRQLADGHPVQCLALLTELARTTQGEPGSRLIRAMLETYPKQGTRVLAEALASTGPHTAGWRGKLDLVETYEPTLAVDGWFTLLRSSGSQQTRAEALNRLAEHAPQRMAKMIRQVARDDDLPADTRVDAAAFAGRRLGDPGSLLRELMDADIEPVERARACAQWGRHSGSTIEAIEEIRDIQNGLLPSSPDRLAVPAVIRAFDSQTAISLLSREIVRGAHGLAVRIGAENQRSALSAQGKAEGRVGLAHVRYRRGPGQFGSSVHANMDSNP